MANAPPGNKYPGIAVGNKYPQWGVGGGTPGSSTGWKAVEVKNQGQKLAEAKKGYLVWFSSKDAADAYISSESSAYSSGEPGNWINSIGGELASAIEGGIVAILKDLWAVVEGPLLIIAGIAIVFAVVIAFFKNDIMQGAKFLGGTLAVAAV